MEIKDIATLEVQVNVGQDVTGDVCWVPLCCFEKIINLPYRTEI